MTREATSSEAELTGCVECDDLFTCAMTHRFDGEEMVVGCPHRKGSGNDTEEDTTMGSSKQETATQDKKMSDEAHHDMQVQVLASAVAIARGISGMKGVNGPEGITFVALDDTETLALQVIIDFADAYAEEFGGDGENG